MPRIIGCPQGHNPDSYTQSLPARFYEALSKSKLSSAPFIYKVARLEACCNSWYSSDPLMLASLWTDFMLVVCSLQSDDIIRPLDNLDRLRQQHVQEMEQTLPTPEIDTPLSMQLERFCPVVRKFYLQGLGCPVVDTREAFYNELKELYPYLYLETRDLVRDWRTISAFEYRLRSIPNFEY